MQDEFASIYARLSEVQDNLTRDSDSKITSLQSDIDALTGSINARIVKEMDTVLTAMEERFVSLRAEALTDEAEIEEFKDDLKKAKSLVELAERNTGLLRSAMLIICQSFPINERRRMQPLIPRKHFWLI
jgi:hypothetical protein